MTKPFAYISAAWPKDDWLRMRKATNYCRIVYDAGYYPICALLSTDLYTNDKPSALQGINVLRWCFTSFLLEHMEKV